MIFGVTHNDVAEVRFVTETESEKARIGANFFLHETQRAVTASDAIEVTYRDGRVVRRPMDFVRRA